MKPVVNVACPQEIEARIKCLNRKAFIATILNLAALAFSLWAMWHH